MRIALILALSVIAAGCTIKVDTVGPLSSSMAASFSGEASAGEFEGSLLSHTRAVQELHPGTLDRFQDPSLGLHQFQGPQLQDPMLLDPTLNGQWDPRMMDWNDPMLQGPRPGGAF